MTRSNSKASIIPVWIAIHILCGAVFVSHRVNSSIGLCFAATHSPRSLVEEQNRSFAASLQSQTQSVQYFGSLPKPDPHTEVETKIYRLRRGDTIYNILRRRGLSSSLIHAARSISKPWLQLDKARIGQVILFENSKIDRTLHRIGFRVDTTSTIWLTPTNLGRGRLPWSINVETYHITQSLVYLQGQIQTSLWDSGSTSNIHAEVIDRLAAIFSGQVDFTHELRSGDSWRLLIEQKQIDSIPVAWGAIAAAEINLGQKSLVAIRFPSVGSAGKYYSLDGVSLSGKFLKQPLTYSRITSSFQSKRFHPILKEFRPHYGVDYAAPIGTPVRAVGHGRVTVSGRRGNCGNTVRIKHDSVFESGYKHLHSIAVDIYRGVQVTQGQIIGYVGRSGLATGPHLHFEVLKNGRYINPFHVSWPHQDRLPSRQMKEFKELAQSLYSRLKEDVLLAEKNDLEQGEVFDLDIWTRAKQKRDGKQSFHFAPDTIRNPFQIDFFLKSRAGILPFRG